MKRLMVMIGAAATALGLFADTATITAKASFEAGEDGIGEGAFTPSQAGWTWTGDPLTLGVYASDAEKYGYTGTGNGRREEFAAQSNYLPLETGSTLTLECPKVTGASEFVDQLVKFTGFEDPQTDVTGKIAVWMSEFITDETTETTETNLYVTAGTGANKTYVKLDNPDGDAWEIGKWYRLTIKSVGKIALDSADETVGFIIYVDGKQVKSSDLAAKTLTDKTLTAANAALLAAGKLFPAMSAGAISTVGYKGTGAIDDVMIDNLGPVFARTVEATVKLIENANLYIENATSVTTNDNDVVFTVNTGDSVTFYFTAAEGYKMAPVTKGPITVEAGETYDYSSEVKPNLVIAKVLWQDEELTYDCTNVVDALTKVQELEQQAVTPIAVDAIVDIPAELVQGFGTIGLKSGARITITAGKWDFTGAPATLLAPIAAEATVTADSDAVFTYAGTVAGTLEADTIDAGGTIKLTGAGTIKSKTGDLTVTTDDAGKKVEKTGPDADEYFTYSLVTAETGFAIIIAGQGGTATTNYVASLQAAFNAVGDGQTIALFADSTAPAIWEGTGAVTLDMNGYAINYTKTASDNAAIKVNNAAANLTITGNGSITVVYPGNGYCVWTRQGTVTIKNGTFTNNDNDDYAIYVGGGDNGEFAGTVNISGGKFVNLNKQPYVWNNALRRLNLNIKNGSKSVINVTGGEFTADPAGGDDTYVPPTFVGTGFYSTRYNDKDDIGESFWKVTDGSDIDVAINDHGYTSLGVAFAAAKAGQTVKLLNDANVCKEEVSLIAADIMIDLNGYEMNLDNEKVALNYSVTFVNTVAGKGGLRNEAQITIAAGKKLDLSAFTWGAGGLLPSVEGTGTTAKFIIGAGAELAMGADAVAPTAYQTTGFLTAAEGGKYTAAGTTYTYTQDRWLGPADCYITIAGVDGQFATIADATTAAKAISPKPESLSVTVHGLVAAGSMSFGVSCPVTVTAAVEGKDGFIGSVSSFGKAHLVGLYMKDACLTGENGAKFTNCVFDGIGNQAYALQNSYGAVTCIGCTFQNYKRGVNVSVSSEIIRTVWTFKNCVFKNMILEDRSALQFAAKNGAAYVEGCRWENCAGSAVMIYGYDYGENSAIVLNSNDFTGAKYLVDDERVIAGKTEDNGPKFYFANNNTNGVIVGYAVAKGALEEGLAVTNVVPAVSFVENLPAGITYADWDAEKYKLPGSDTEYTLAEIEAMERGTVFLVKPGFAAPAETAAYTVDADTTVANCDFAYKMTTKYYDIKFISGADNCYTETVNKAYGAELVAPDAQTIVGKTFSAWNPAVVSPVAGAAEYVAQYEDIMYEVTFSTNKVTVAEATTSIAHGTALTAAKIPAFEGGTWDVDPTNAVITCATNFNYTIKAQDIPEPAPGSNATVVEVPDAPAGTYAVAPTTETKDIVLQNVKVTDNFVVVAQGDLGVESIAGVSASQVTVVQKTTFGGKEINISAAFKAVDVGTVELPKAQIVLDDKAKVPVEVGTTEVKIPVKPTIGETIEGITIEDPFVSGETTSATVAAIPGLTYELKTIDLSTGATSSIGAGVTGTAGANATVTLTDPRTGSEKPSAEFYVIEVTK